ncbi:MAG TPA: hypothetical protein VF456_04500 [Vicinamibacterales bacterium]
MNLSVDVWLRGQDFATTKNIAGVVREPHAWTDDDVRTVLHGMLLAMHRLKHPNETETAIVLRGLSWIVNPYEEGGVLIAIEITMGAAIAGPFDIDQALLESMIARVLRSTATPQSDTVH